MEKNELTDKLDYFFSAFCYDFFAKTREGVEKYKWAIPLDKLGEVLINIYATEEELREAVKASTYLRLEGYKVVVPRPDKPYALSVFVSAFPKCIPSYRFRQAISQVLSIDAFVYDYIVESAADMMSFMVTFKNEADKQTFCAFFRQFSYDIFSKQEFNRFHARIKLLRDLYKDFDKKNPLVSFVTKIDAVKERIFWAEVCDGIKQMHERGLKQFTEVREYRKKNHVKNFWEKKNGQSAEVRTGPLYKPVERPSKGRKSRFSK